MRRSSLDTDSVDVAITREISSDFDSVKIVADNITDVVAAAEIAVEPLKTAILNAEGNATSADISAGESATSAADALISEGNSLTSATASEVSRQAALVAQTACELIFDMFDDIYLGPKATNPVLDNDGDPIITGALYFNTTTNSMRVYSGTWGELTALALLSTNNLSDVDDASISRSNLGVESTTELNSRDTANRNRDNHTGTQSIDTIIDSATHVKLTAIDKSKLDNIEASATADQTATEIEGLYEGIADTNKYTDLEKTKLTNIEANATSDQTASEIEAAYEALPDTNKLTDAGVASLASFDELAATYNIHGVINPTVDIMSQNVVLYTMDIAEFDYYISGTKFTQLEALAINPSFLVGESFAYVGVNEDGLVIKKESGFNADDYYGTVDSYTPNKSIIQLGIIRSLSSGVNSNLDIVSNSPYYIDEAQKRMYARSQFDGTSYDKTAALVGVGTTPKQLKTEAGDYVDGNNELRAITATDGISGASTYNDGSGYAIAGSGVIEVSTTQYNPSTTLEAIPAGKFVTHSLLHSPRTNGFFFVYGRTAFDTISEAVSAQEDLGPVAGDQLADVNAVATITVKEGESIIRHVKDIRHKIGADNLPTLTEGTQNISTAFNGSIREKLSLTYRQAGSLVYVDVEKGGTGDLTVQLDGSSYSIDCTTGAGLAGKATAQLTLGAATSLQENYIYVTLVAGIATVSISASAPSGDVAIIGKCNLLDLARFTLDNDQPVTSQQYNNAASIDGQGLFTRGAERIRRAGPAYISGVDQTASIVVNGGAIDTLDVDTTSGIVYQFNKGVFQERTGAKKFVVINHPTTPFLEIDTLDEIDVDASGNSLRGNNTRYGLNILGGQNSGGADDRLYVLLPIDTYDTDISVLKDVDNNAVTTVSQNLSETLFRICRIVVKYETPGSTLINLVGAGLVQDERGFPLSGAGAGGAGGGAVTEFSTGQFQVYDPTDPTKTGQFDVSGITTGTNRVMSLPDQNGTLALEETTYTRTIIDNELVNNIGTVADFDAALT